MQLGLLPALVIACGAYTIWYIIFSHFIKERMTQSHAMPLGGFVCILSLTLYSKKTNPTAI